MAFPDGWTDLDTDIADNTDTDNADPGKDHATVHNQLAAALNDLAAATTTTGDLLTRNSSGELVRITRAALAADNAFNPALDINGLVLGHDFAESSGAWVANTAYFYRLPVFRKVTVNRIALNISASSGNLDLGIYADDGTGLAPGSRITSIGSTASPGTGRRTFTIADTTLDPGVYWVAFAADNNSLTTSRSTLAAAVWKQMSQSKATSFPLPSSVSGLTTGVTLHACWLENL